jgi:hypothetical protein
LNPFDDDAGRNAAKAFRETGRNAAEAFRETGVRLKPDSTSDFGASLDAVDTGAGAVPPWEEIEAGRYMPRRIRGSYRGRELG